MRHSCVVPKSCSPVPHRLRCPEPPSPCPQLPASKANRLGRYESHDPHLGCGLVRCHLCKRAARSLVTPMQLRRDGRTGGRVSPARAEPDSSVLEEEPGGEVQPGRGLASSFSSQGPWSPCRWRRRGTKGIAVDEGVADHDGAAAVLEQRIGIGSMDLRDPGLSAASTSKPSPG